MALFLPIQAQLKPNLLIFRFIKKVIERGIVNTAVTFRISTGTLNRFGLLQGELHHQQYDAKPGGGDYCGLAPLGVKLPRGDWEAAGNHGDDD